MATHTPSGKLWMKKAVAMLTPTVGSARVATKAASGESKEKKEEDGQPIRADQRNVDKVDKFMLFQEELRSTNTRTGQPFWQIVQHDRNSSQNAHPLQFFG